jgi:transcriptional regulator with GAF, ATPase, and Fis domain
MSAALAHDLGLFHFEGSFGFHPFASGAVAYQLPCADQALQERSKCSELSLGTSLRGAGTKVSLPRTASISPPPRYQFHGLVGATATMRQLYQRIEVASATKGKLLIVGENGTGKELVACAIHECGPRRDRPS